MKVASTSGLVPGTRLFCEGELMEVISLGVSPWVNVSRGVDGTAAVPHNSLALIYVGTASQFYETDPKGRPEAAIAVSPWINALANRIWWAQGDTTPSATANRWWQLETTAYDTGALGVQFSTTSPTSST